MYYNVASDPTLSVILDQIAQSNMNLESQKKVSKHLVIVGLIAMKDRGSFTPLHPAPPLKEMIYRDFSAVTSQRDQWAVLLLRVFLLSNLAWPHSPLIYPYTPLRGEFLQLERWEGKIAAYLCDAPTKF